VSEEENKALVRRFFEAQSEGNLEAMKEMISPDFVDHSLLPGQNPDREGYLRGVAEEWATFSITSITVEDQIARDDKVVTRCRSRSRHDRREFMGVAPTGREIEVTGIYIHRLAGGKIIGEWSEGSGILELMEGLVEQEARERERYEQELRVARQIQQALLPKDQPQLEGWQIKPYYQPAREVGGDFYDFLELEDGRLGVVVGDATGHGVPAALVMATTQSVLRTVAQMGSAPGQALAEANEVLFTYIPPNMFVTCFYCILDPKSGRLLYANAGHDLPFVLRHHHGEGLADELRARGMPLGLMPEMSYEEKEVVLRKGDVILFYSDGLVEAHNPKGEMFGFPRLGRLVARHLSEGKGLTAFLLEELERFVGEGWEQEDDITLLTLRRHATRDHESSSTRFGD
jgi:serine phosphatase RsbU (regulator of sigma subunit)/predicted ester cyclase